VARSDNSRQGRSCENLEASFVDQAKGSVPPMLLQIEATRFGIWLELGQEQDPSSVGVLRCG
jgi:hypothetical protein